MNGTTKKPSELNAENVLRSSHVQETGVLSVGGFVAAKVGHRITLDIATTTVVDDTEIYRYFDGSAQLMELTIVYTDASRSTLLSVTRTA
jgi:hypothetical protein